LTRGGAIEEIGRKRLKVVQPQVAFGNDKPHQRLLDQPVLTHCIVDELPKAGVCEWRAVPLHDLESPRQLASALDAERGAKGDVGDVGQRDVRPALVKVNAVSVRERLEPEVDEIRQQDVLLVDAEEPDLPLVDALKRNRGAASARVWFWRGESALPLSLGPLRSIRRVGFGRRVR
jgi:hypothetical protein